MLTMIASYIRMKRILPAKLFPLSPDGAIIVVMPLAFVHLVCGTAYAWLMWGWVAGVCTGVFETIVIGMFVWKMAMIASSRQQIHKDTRD